MGKKQHQKDRLFLTNKEWKEEWGGYKSKKHLPFHRLPFHCCAIAFTAFEDPVCTEDGTVFDVTNIVPYITKHHTHPVTGKPLQLSELIPLTFHKNADGEYECPILKKVFTQVRRTYAISERVLPCGPSRETAVNWAPANPLTHLPHVCSTRTSSPSRPAAMSLRTKPCSSST